MVRALTKHIPTGQRTLRRLFSLAAFLFAFVFFVNPFRNEQPLLHIPDTLYTPSLFNHTFDRRSYDLTRPQHRFRAQQHMYLDNGLLEVNSKARHPIYDLIDRSEKEWDHKVHRQSRTLPQAVQEYKRRYGRAPPTGFDKWWNYVQKHNVQLPDEYDQIMNDLERFNAHTPADLRRLQNVTRLGEGTWSFTANSTTGNVTLSNLNVTKSQKRTALQRAEDQLNLINGFGEQWMDDDGSWTSVGSEIVTATGDWEMTFTIHDGPAQFTDWDLNDKKVHSAEYGEYLDIFEKPQNHKLGWAAACPPYSPLRQQMPLPPTLPLADPAPKTFIYDHKKLMDPCNHPDLVHISGFFSAHGKGHDPHEQQKLIFSISKSTLHGDVLVPPMEGWMETAGRDHSWSAKADERLVWRGTTTGISHAPHTPWNSSHRIRFVQTLNDADRTRTVLLPPHARTSKVGEPVERPASYLNSVFADVAFTGKPSQCEKGVCETMQNMFEWRSYASGDLQNKYKYIMDIDGNGWSSRFKRLVTSNSLVLKASIFPEWYSDRIMPWVHYVPIKMDYTDLFDVMTFFRGDVINLGKDAHDDLAERIALSGAQWSKAFFRKEDMVAYMWRLLLEYGRLMNDRRDEMNFVL